MWLSRAGGSVYLTSLFPFRINMVHERGVGGNTAVGDNPVFAYGRLPLRHESVYHDIVVWLLGVWDAMVLCLLVVIWLLWFGCVYIP
jgi:hypothetical protein